MTTEPIRRCVGEFGASGTGPLLVVIGGLHGNEPAGVFASRRVFERLRSIDPPFRGRLVALAGNLTALARGCRYMDEDLNRIWLPELISNQERGTVSTTVEVGERTELLAAIQSELARAFGPKYFLDLHTTSASGSPFSVLADTLHNRSIARGLPAPMVLGLEEHLDGTLLNFINELGHVAIGFEGGQHEAAASINAHELAVWRMLVMARCMEPSDCPQLGDLMASVGEQTRNSPSVVEIRYRHPVEPNDGFAMESGFKNLQSVERGELLARDRTGEIRASESGRVLMPLYQTQGEDGFFLVRRVRPIWLSVAAFARRWRLDRILHFMPGVEPHPETDSFVVNPDVARWFVMEVFHLLGFRRRRAMHGRLVLTRRREVPLRR